MPPTMMPGVRIGRIALPMAERSSCDGGLGVDRVVATLGVEVDHHHEGKAHQRAGQHTSEKQAADRDRNDTAPHHHQYARRNDDAHHRRTGDQRYGEFDIVALLFIAGISTPPTPAASAVLEPEMPANSMLTSTLTWPNPPGSQPTRARDKLISLSVMPAAFIRFAASMKKGIESSRNELYDFSISLSSRNGVSRSSMKNTGTQASPERECDRHARDHQQCENAEQNQGNFRRSHIRHLSLSSSVGCSRRTSPG